MDERGKEKNKKELKKERVGMAGEKKKREEECTGKGKKEARKKEGN